MSDIERISEEIIHRGLRFRLTRVRERLPDGREAIREILRHPGAAVVLPVFDDGRVLLVEQHRTTLGGALLELPAGTLEPGEDPLEGAARELEEETGYRARDLRPLVSFYPAPGVTDECMHVFLATGLEEGEQRLDETELVEIRILPLDLLRTRMLEGEIRDGKTLVALLYVMFVGLASGEERRGTAGP